MSSISSCLCSRVPRLPTAGIKDSKNNSISHFSVVESSRCSTCTVFLTFLGGADAGEEDAGEFDRGDNGGGGEFDGVKGRVKGGEGVEVSLLSSEFISFDSSSPLSPVSLSVNKYIYNKLI